MDSTLPIIWFFLLVGIVVLFVILDGADLGLGIMSLFEREGRKSWLIEAVGPLWYANETWLVITGGVLFGAFPLAYSMILSSLYIPVAILIFGLMFRAVTTELRRHAVRKTFWNWAFGAGCLLAALGQGFLIGGLLTNPEAVRTAGIGGWSWLNLTSVLVALGFAAAYAMIGAAHLVRSRDIDIRPELWRFLRYATGLASILFLLVMLLIPLLPATDGRMWLHGSRVFMVPAFAFVAIFCLAAVRLRSQNETRGGGLYAWSVAAFLSIGCVVVAALYPFIIPFSVSIREAASSHSTLIFMIFGVGIFLPIIIIYNLYIARVFSRESSKSGSG